MKIGNWDGGPGEEIIVRIKSDELKRCERTRLIFDALREAGFDCDLHISDDSGSIRKTDDPSVANGRDGSSPS